MKLPRFRIGRIMALVAIVALDFGAMRAGYLNPTYLDSTRKPYWLAITADTVAKREMLARGSLPMANILAIGLLIGLRRRGSHPSLLGFEAFGVVALVLYTAWAFFEFPRHHQYNDLVRVIQHHRLIPAFIRNYHLPCQIAVSVALVLPQLAFALLGGFLSRKFREAGRSDQRELAEFDEQPGIFYDQGQSSQCRMANHPGDPQ